MKATTDKPVVTVVTPAFNCRALIGEAIDSVRRQSFPDWEHLIIDDGSTDGTADLVEQLAAEDARIKLIRLSKNLGPAVARNKGIELASGRYLAFLDSDDLWYPDKLEVQIAFMARTRAALTYTNYQQIDGEYRVIGFVRSPDQISERDLLRSNQIACSTAVCDLVQIGRVYMPLIRKRQDWGLWLQIARRGHVARNVGRTLARYRVRSDSLSSNKLSAMLYNWRFFRDVAALPFHERAYRIVAYAAIASWKYLRAKIDRPAAISSDPMDGM